jgi:hypothetical protein
MCPEGERRATSIAATASIADTAAIPATAAEVQAAKQIKEDTGQR